MTFECEMLFTVVIIHSVFTERIIHTILVLGYILTVLLAVHARPPAKRRTRL